MREYFGTIGDPFSAHWYLDFRGELSHPTLALGATFTNEYYEAMRAHGDRLAELVSAKGLRVFQTLIVRLADLAAPTRAAEIASVISNTRTTAIYLILLSDVKPRDELRDVDELKGAMRLIDMLETSGLSVLVGCVSSDVLLWKAAGATACATGKFANLRRFTPGRFSDQDDGGRLVPYWFEEPLLAFLRASDIQRVQAHGMAVLGSNPFSAQILAQLAGDPTKAWVALGWKQYMHWFADVEARLNTGAANARDLIRAAEKNWQLLEENDVFMEERANDGSWLRPWLCSVVEFNK